MLSGGGSARAAAMAVSVWRNSRGRGSIGTGRRWCSGRKNRPSRPGQSAAEQREVEHVLDERGGRAEGLELAAWPPGFGQRDEPVFDYGQSVGAEVLVQDAPARPVLRGVGMHDPGSEEGLSSLRLPWLRKAAGSDKIARFHSGR